MEPLDTDELQDFLKLLERCGWDYKVEQFEESRWTSPYVVVDATPRTFRHQPEPDVEVSVCWHTYGTGDGSYRLFDAGVYDYRDVSIEPRFVNHDSVVEDFECVKTYVEENAVQ